MAGQGPLEPLIGVRVPAPELFLPEIVQFKENK